jgi:hypothetical protein
MKFSVELLLRSWTFLGVLSAFAVANAWSWIHQRIDPVCCDHELTIGFPVPFHISGGLAGLSNFYLLGLLLDISIALTIAVTVTWLVKLVKR